MKKIEKLIKKYEKTFLENVSSILSSCSREECLEMLERLKDRKKKILSENNYSEVIGNKKYFQCLILENIFKSILTEIKPKRTTKKVNIGIRLREL